MVKWCLWWLSVFVFVLVLVFVFVFVFVFVSTNQISLLEAPSSKFSTDPLHLLSLLPNPQTSDAWVLFFIVYYIINVLYYVLCVVQHLYHLLPKAWLLFFIVLSALLSLYIIGSRRLGTWSSLFFQPRQMPLFQNSNIFEHICHSCHKGKPGPFIQCYSVLAGQNRTGQYFCMYQHAILCNLSKRTGVLRKPFLYLYCFPCALVHCSTGVHIIGAWWLGFWSIRGGW